ncbi:alpha-L-arabinofuranosidase C-terminal domain-containing protein [Actinocatenispora rupis]|uniref:non-reducing end alpha-L-arabinofuranosidase n=1 Tax=Actinocatenispora rupis TaxID=519421 RepID=A0A8J3NCZ8_9ACTN|nr:alpha-L-arabinofuranosidase C-terminal domain-containing protein [Actinocatenispora rupis]GID12337.1 alpha-N-arabinofuranosidase [Actinocatenispora rupis]
MTTTDAEIAIGSRPSARIDPLVYGHFLESAFFGNIEGGVFDEGSPLAVSGAGALDGCRRDVIDACRELGLPVVRWPGGNFASAYWWRDGTGPRDERPRRLELAWGSEESNRFGTPEFLAWIGAVRTDAVRTEAYLCHGARSVEDAVRWVEYTNYAGDTTLTRQRAADGHAEPYRVRWWGVGNEVYGPWQMGHRPVERYVADAREHVRFMRQVDPGLRFVACGSPRQQWTEAVVAGLGDRVDAFSLHLYGVDHHLTTPTVDEYDAVVSQSVYFEHAIGEYADEIAAVATASHLDRPPGIALDEWNNRHLEPSGWPEPRPGDDGGTAARDTPAGERTRVRVNRHSTRTLADALMYAGVFHAIHRAAGHEVPVTMANTVNLVNANGILQVRPGGVLRTPVFHVWDLYQNHFGRRALPVRVSTPAVVRAVRLGAERTDRFGVGTTRTTAVGLLDASAAGTDDGGLTLAVINRSADRTVRAAIRLDDSTGSLPPVARVWSFGADATDLFATNTLSTADTVAPRTPDPTGTEPGRYDFPPHSVTMLRFDPR